MPHVIKSKRRMPFATACLFFLILFPAYGESSRGASAFATASTTSVLRSLGYHGLTLDGGRMREQFDEVKAYYMAIPNDSLLKGFRSRAGIPAPGTSMGGWYGSDTFHTFGQFLSAYARMYAATGDAACKQKLEYLIAEWAKCIRADGFFYYSSNPNAPHYTYDKMVCGLVDAYHYADLDAALEYLSRITVWAEANLDRTKQYGYNWMNGPTEWYTLTENLYRAYLYTGDVRYRDFGQVWEYTSFWNAFANGTDIWSLNPHFGRYHAYSHVNSLSGAALAYQLTAETHYLDTLRNAYDYLVETQMWATGGYGPVEKFLRPADQALTVLDLWENQFETQCGSWAAFKLYKSLISFTGEAKYGDWIERVFWNGIGASIPMSAAGEVQYNSHYHLGGAWKSNNNGAWTCCSGTRPQAVADYYDLIYFQGNDGLYVNLFTDSSAKINHNGSTITLTQRTTFPEGNASDFSISLNEPTSFVLAFRSPQWLAAPMLVEVNGVPFSAAANAKGWVTVSRFWKQGDSVYISLPMQFAAERFPSNSAKPFPAAISYGPLVMALKHAGPNPQAKIKFADINSTFVSVPGNPLTFHLASDSSIIAKPYAAFLANEEYFMYFDPDYPWSRIEHLEISYTGAWSQDRSRHWSSNIGASAQYTFSGTSVRLRFTNYKDAGIAGIFIDGIKVADVDQYSWLGSLAGPVSHTINNLSVGSHTIRIEVQNKKHADSTNYSINIMGLDYIPPVEPIPTPTPRPPSLVRDWAVY